MIKNYSVDGEVICTMVSPLLLEDVIDIAKDHGCNVIIKTFHAWKMIKTVFHEKNLIYSPGSTLYFV
jgi:hypothetical protein